MPYQVAWARCNVFDDKGAVTTLDRGDYVPDEIDDVQKSQLATIGAVRFVDVNQAPLEEGPMALVTAPFATGAEFTGDADGLPVGFVDTSLGVPSGSPLSGQDPNTEPLLARSGPDVPSGEPQDEDGPPSKSASKPEWEAYAVSQGASEEEAAASTKADLIAKYGG